METLTMNPVAQAANPKTRLIDGRHVEYLETRVSISDLVLDPANPRIQYELKTGFGTAVPTDEQVAGLLWKRDSVKRLCAAIKQDGGIIEHLYLKPLPGGKYLVLEGNERTVSGRHLFAKDPASPRFATVPAWIFADLSACETAVLVNELHVAGKDEWPPYEQSREIFELANEHGKSKEWIATQLRLSKSKVVQKMAAYEALSDYLTSIGGNDPRAVTKFSFFEELMKKRLLKERYISDADFKRRFHQWVKHGKLVDAKDVRHLQDVLDSTDACAIFESEGIAAAEAFLATESPELASNLFAAIKKATELISKSPQSDLKALKFGDAKKLKIVRDLHRGLEDMASLGNFTL